MAATGSVNLIGLSPEAQTQLKTVDEILRTRNDNDPRMDTVLRQLLPHTKTALLAKYQSLPPEDRNGRGTIAFLVGRNIKTERDLEFLKEVLNEAPCLSLANCSREPSARDSHEAHLESGANVTLAYPQLVALHAIEKYLGEHSELSPAFREAATRALQAGKMSQNPVIIQKAAQVEKLLSRG